LGLGPERKILPRIAPTTVPIVASVALAGGLDVIEERGVSRIRWTVITFSIQAPYDSVAVPAPMKSISRATYAIPITRFT
jgi:hypothetical protein